MNINVLLNNLECKIDDIEKNNDIDELFILYKDGKKIIKKCEKKMETMEKLLEDDINLSNNKDSITLEQMVERMDEINTLLTNENIDIEEYINLFIESKKIEKQYNNYIEQYKYLDDIKK